MKEVYLNSKPIQELMGTESDIAEISVETATWLTQNYSELYQTLKYTSPVFGKFYFQKDGFYIGIDNTSGDAFAEEFLTLEGVTFWLDNYHLEYSIVKNYDLECAWKELEDVPFDEVDSVLCLAVDWKTFEVGTSQEDIWHYFDAHYSKGVAYLLNEHDPKDKNIDLEV